ncbi:spore germination protein D [Scopulibacillus daqui]|uniref:Spore germination protein D n=1 Tax=Scopulibacillus daqui TaxID=1469162 RepID=A0ABS2Q3U1_9BACL|nr:spore germination lipoprotein GerD [Scopulibacillus daqui]MBM7646898.1 spore germination protein D [Scopulibacillus daqui]
MPKAVLIFIFSVILLFAGGCAAQQAAEGNQPNYQETKKMFVDLLKTDEGKKAIQDVLQDSKVKQQLVFNQDFVKDTIAKTLTSKEGKEYWEKLFSDPKFKKDLAKTMQKQNETILKQLMNDPSYQQMMMNILKAPKMQNQYLDLMKTKPYREQMQKVVAETLSSPLMASQLSEAINKAVQDQIKKSGGQGGGQGGKGQQGGS